MMIFSIIQKTQTFQGRRGEWSERNGGGRRSRREFGIDSKYPLCSCAGCSRFLGGGGVVGTMNEGVKITIVFVSCWKVYILENKDQSMIGKHLKIGLRCAVVLNCVLGLQIR